MSFFKRFWQLAGMGIAQYAIYLVAFIFNHLPESAALSA